MTDLKSKLDAVMDEVERDCIYTDDGSAARMHFNDGVLRAVHTARPRLHALLDEAKGDVVAPRPPIRGEYVDGGLVIGTDGPVPTAVAVNGETYFPAPQPLPVEWNAKRTEATCGEWKAVVLNPVLQQWSFVHNKLAQFSSTCSIKRIEPILRGLAGSAPQPAVDVDRMMATVHDAWDKWLDDDDDNRLESEVVGAAIRQALAAANIEDAGQLRRERDEAIRAVGKEGELRGKVEGERDTAIRQRDYAQQQWHKTHSLWTKANDEIAGLKATLDNALRERDEEHSIVDRVWKALGISTYEDARGKAIDELVAELREKLAAAEERGKRMEEALTAIAGNRVAMIPELNKERYEWVIQRARQAITHREPISRPGAAIQAERLDLSPEAEKALNVGSAKIPGAAEQPCRHEKVLPHQIDHPDWRFGLQLHRCDSCGALFDRPAKGDSQ